MILGIHGKKNTANCPAQMDFLLPQRQWVTRSCTFLLNAFRTAVNWSQGSADSECNACRSQLHRLWCATSDPVIIHLQRAARLVVSPTAPPSPSTMELHCSCAWSSAAAENGPPEFCWLLNAQMDVFWWVGTAHANAQKAAVCSEHGPWGQKKEALTWLSWSVFAQTVQSFQPRVNG